MVVKDDFVQIQRFLREMATQALVVTKVTNIANLARNGDSLLIISSHCSIKAHGFAGICPIFIV